MENKGISNKLDAWLAFLSMDSPEMIMELSNKYPEFKAMYEHVYNIITIPFAGLESASDIHPIGMITPA